MNVRPDLPPDLRSGVRPRPGLRLLHWCALLLLCAAYLQGGIDKALDFPGAIAEMAHFGLAPAGPLAALTILGELGASALILAGIWRWAGALYLALFTFAATLLANRFWELAGPARFMAENGFFEHLGLSGGFLLVLWLDLGARQGRLWSPRAPAPAYSPSP